MKKLFALILALTMILALCACGNTNAATTETATAGEAAAEEKPVETVELKLAHNLAEDHPLHLAAMKFAEDVEAGTNGAVKVTVYPNAVLGTEVEAMEQLQNGAVDMCRVGGGTLENFNSIFSAFTIPYLFDSEESFYNVMNSEIAGNLYTATEDSGFICLTFFDGGARSFYTTDTEINSPEDLAGLKIRVMENPTSIAMMEAFNASAVPMAYGDIYTALQQKVIDGAENNPTALTLGKHGEVAKYYSLDEHLRIPDFLVISTATWNKLTAEQQEVFKEAAAASTEYHAELWKASVEEALQLAQDEYGVTITYPDKTAFREACKPLYENLEKTQPEIYALVESILDYQANN